MTYPNLKNEKIIALDIETKDDDIIKLGPGYHRAKDGLSKDTILTVAICTQSGTNYGFPYNYNTQQWLKDNKHLSIVGANVLYDLGWLYCYAGIKFDGAYHDILNYESVIDGGQGWYSLDKLAKKYLNEDKKNDEIKQYAENMGWKGDARQYLYKMPVELVVKYNKNDARQTMEIYQKQKEHFHNAELFTLESDILKVLLRMKKTGVRVDTNKIEQSAHDIQNRIDIIQAQINTITGFETNTASTIDMEKAFTKLGLDYPVTNKGNPSFSTDILKDIPNDFAGKIVEIRELNKLQNTYIEGMQKFIVNGRLYTEFVPVRNGSRGTQTGRFSSVKPALQQIPSRGESKKIARGFFIPEDGCMWEKQDQSQEEYRIFAHYARGIGAERLHQGFLTDNNFDMHEAMRKLTGLKDRKTAKMLNFLSLYGGGVHKFALAINEKVPPPWPVGQGYDAYLQAKEDIINNYKAARLYFQYHDNMPCIKITGKTAERACKHHGYAKTLLDRRRYLSDKQAYKALNTTIQGTGGDIMKKWLVECEKAGLFDVLQPHLTVHDEIDFSKPQTKEGEDAAKEVKIIGETCIKLKVPLKVDREHGTNWGELGDIND